MATEVQYGVFKALYDDEDARYSNLEARARAYFAIISLYLGAIAFKITDIGVFAAKFHVPFVLFLLTGLVLVAALLFDILGMWLRDYERICDPGEVIRGFGPQPPSDADFLDDRLADLAVATNRNVRANNKTANCLVISSWLMFVGVILHLGIMLWALRQAI